MMRWSCRRYQPRLVDHADGVLDAAHQQRLEQHLTRCPDCRADLEALRALPDVLQTSTVPDPGSAFWQQQRQAIGRTIGNLPSPPSGWPLGWLHELLQVSPWRYPLAATVVLVLGLTVYRFAQPPSAPEGASMAAQLATLDTDVLLAVGELAQALTAPDNALSDNPPDDEVAVAALAVADLVGPHPLAHVPDETDLNDAELDGVDDLIGTIG
jgi:anti-sigma factor RsiW